MSDDEEQVTGESWDTTKEPPELRAVGLYLVIGKERTIRVWAESSFEAEKIGIVEGVKVLSVEPVCVEASNGQS